MALIGLDMQLLQVNCLLYNWIVNEIEIGD